MRTSTGRKTHGLSGSWLGRFLVRATVHVTTLPAVMAFRARLAFRRLMRRWATARGILEAGGIITVLGLVLVVTVVALAIVIVVQAVAPDDDATTAQSPGPGEGTTSPAVAPEVRRTSGPPPSAAPTSPQPTSRVASRDAGLRRIVTMAGAANVRPTTVSSRGRPVAGVAVTADLGPASARVLLHVDGTATALDLTVVAGDNSSCSWTFTGAGSLTVSASWGTRTRARVRPDGDSQVSLTVRARAGSHRSCVVTDARPVRDGRPAPTAAVRPSSVEPSRAEPTTTAGADPPDPAVSPCPGISLAGLCAGVGAMTDVVKPGPATSPNG